MLIAKANRPRLPARGPIFTSTVLSNHHQHPKKGDLVLAKLKMKAREVVLHGMIWFLHLQSHHCHKNVPSRA